ncbi:hypothetical protein QAD02_020194 [Eretmocerus hayati]|uniref:Uncharacterized protein n=1 Tax=Eretmocerus hayati TaxID=131215 RepID=A0ACC2PPY2_9HYME|nr:hypothetical protein QAD02_020194 [Eretmocerus hayati]
MRGLPLVFIRLCTSDDQALHKNLDQKLQKFYHDGFCYYDRWPSSRTELRIETEIFYHFIKKTDKMQAQPDFTPKFFLVLFHGNNNTGIDGTKATVPKKCMVVEAPPNQPSVVKYLPPPYQNKKKVQAINRVVLSGEDVPPTWEQYFCTITYQRESIEVAQYCFQNPSVCSDSSVENMVIENDPFDVPNGSGAIDHSEVDMTNQQPATILSSNNGSGEAEQNGVASHEQSNIFFKA